LHFFAIMIVVAKCYCTTALLKCRRRGSYCYLIPFCLLLLTASLTAAISAEVIYSAIFIQKIEMHNVRRRAHRRGRRRDRRHGRRRGRSVI
jgi:hypothetical protein